VTPDPVTSDTVTSDTVMDSPPDPVIEVRDATARIDGRTLWSDVHLSVGAGEFIAVLGPNGAGKSTLVKAILGLRSLDGGEIRVLGGRPGRANQRIGYLPQRRSFDSSLRVRGTDIVRLGLDGHRWGTPLPRLFGTRRREMTARIADAIKLVGAGEYAHRPIGELSGGEQQRLLIAQALVREPAVLLLDEPLDSLDLPNQAAVAALISDICRRRRVSVVMVAHDVNPILPYLDRVIYVAHGRVAAGTPEEVITSGTLSLLYGTPVEVVRTSTGQLVVVGAPEAPARHTNRHAERTPVDAHVVG
jgi:zinc/manganese transport system ATP-binding protein